MQDSDSSFIDSRVYEHATHIGRQPHTALELESKRDFHAAMRRIEAWFQGEVLDRAPVVIGGTLLTGGVGYVFGTMFGVLIDGLIQVLIMFNGELSSWWTRIVIGLLTLVFILVQSTFASWKKRQVSLKPARKTGAGAPVSAESLVTHDTIGPQARRRPPSKKVQSSETEPFYPANLSPVR